ncbi:hypothetical protein [Streptomyces flavotricini]|uniref:hypothetical protein n=1 Tax=Streptomyces flavotricini TaxID=66888 RepID=UPI003559084B
MGGLADGGATPAEIAERFDVPACVLDEGAVRERCRTYRDAFPDADVLYAAKAFLSRAMVRWVDEEGWGSTCARQVSWSSPSPVRVVPGVAAGGHDKIRTGTGGQKFGLSLADGGAQHDTGGWGRPHRSNGSCVVPVYGWQTSSITIAAMTPQTPTPSSHRASHPAPVAMTVGPAARPPRRVSRRGRGGGGRGPVRPRG